MPWLVALAGVLANLVPSLVGRVLLALGIGFFSYTGMDVIMSGLRDLFMSNAAGIPAYAVGFLGLLKIGTCFNILMSAIAIKMALAGAAGGAIRRMGAK